MRHADLADPAEVERRRALLDRPHIAPLADLAQRIRCERGAAPDADPLDGGVAARLLLLLETPGARGRTGFVSRDNPTGTAANLRRFLGQAEIAREDTLIWNAVPWVIHEPGARNRPPRPAEIAAGQDYLGPLMGLLPRLKVVVLAGRAAARAAQTLAHPGRVVLAMPHPSPTFVCTSPRVAEEIRAVLSDARDILARG